MSPVPVTPQRIRTIAGQFGFRGLLITDGNIVKSMLRSGKVSLLQEVGEVNDAQRLLDFCRQEDIDIEDDRTTPIPEWREDPWIQHGA